MGKNKNKHPSQSSKNITSKKKKSKKGNQKRAIEDNELNVGEGINDIGADLQKLIDEASENHKNAANLAKETYNSLIKAVENSDLILQILDARDPHACRLVELEKLVSEKGKPLINVINKADLIPKEVAIRWLGDFQKAQISQTVMISALDSNLSALVLSEAISKVGAQKVSVVGIQKVGKSTICTLNQAFNEIVSYSFISSNGDAALIGACEYNGEENDFVLETITRSQDESIFDALGIEPQDDENNVMKEFAKVSHKKVREATNEFVGCLLDGRQPFFAVPDDTPATDLSENQQNVIDKLKSSENGDDAIHLAKGEPLILNTLLLETQTEAPPVID